MAIYGSDLSINTGDWSSVLQLPDLPKVLSGVSVTIDGKAAAVYFVSPTQINVQAPDASPGPVQVIVTNNGLTSAPFTAQLRTHAPALFQWGATKYAVATRYPDNVFVGVPSIGAGFVSARNNDVLVLWATGFGPTSPAVAAGVVVPGVIVAETVTPVSVTVNGVEARVFGAALSPGLAGVYQIAIQLPTGLPAGDVLIKASIAGFSTPDNVYLNIAN